MKEYLLSVMAVAIFGSVSCAVCPGGEGKSLRTSVTLITSLLMILSVVKPIILFVNSGEKYNAESIIEDITMHEDSKYDAVWRKTLAASTTEAYNGYISELICEKFDINLNNFSVETKFESDKDTIRPELVTIKLFGMGLFKNPRAIASEIEAILDCECVVSEEWG
ncbi:MAG: hypothetical protein IKT56_04890 [Clostridia bacterium]|nr:hypothetical protein [Clostridia bacterium]